MKYLHIFLKIFFSLILILPIIGATGLFGGPTREMYHSDQAFLFIQVIDDALYITYMMVVVHILALAALWTRREALGALLVLPITLNVVGFHLFLDGGLLTGGALLGNIMLLINLYLLYRCRETYQILLKA